MTADLQTWYLVGGSWKRRGQASLFLRQPEFAPASYWNRTLGDMYPSGVPIHASSASFMGRVLDGKGATPQRNYLGSDTSQSTLPIYEVDNSTPLSTVRVFQSWRYGNDANIDGTFQVSQDVQAPIPANVKVPGFSDYQVVLLNVDTGEEWDFWKCGTDETESAANPGRDADSFWQPYDTGDGTLRYTCQSAGLYRPTGGDGSAGVGGFINGMGTPSTTPKAWGMRGAKVPYSAGLVRKWEIDAGSINHAIAWAYHGPSPDHVYPALNSDGGNFGGVSGTDIPEGARIRLNPAVDLTTLPTGAARVIGKALQDYGAILIDNAGFPKVYLEYDYTAGWGGDVTASMLSAAALSSYQVIDWTAAVA